MESAKGTTEHENSVRPVADDVNQEPENTPKAETSKRTKRTVALFVAYNGEGYQGWQYNKNIKTLEGVLENAIYSSGGISAGNHGDISKVGWTRAARTDKGVSAVGQVVSLRIMHHSGDIVSEINSQLPDEIRVLGCVRVTRHFNAWKLCDKRKYEYCMPLWLTDNSKFTNGHGKLGTRSLECGDALKDKINRILRNYVGTHDFHNFTTKVQGGSSQAKRYILEFCWKDLIEINGEAWIRLLVVGQSFLLHQIRKMVGMMIAILRGFTPENSLEAALTKDWKVDVPVAPSLGLYLDECFYETYNAKWSHKQDLVSLDMYRNNAEYFKTKLLYPRMVELNTELQEFESWLKNLLNKELTLVPWKQELQQGSKKRQRETGMETEPVGASEISS